MMTLMFKHYSPLIHGMLILFITILFFLSIDIGHDAESALLYKDYVIRYDRGWDILCDPYQVKKNDWVFKIFRQKGEISHTDFREFIGIFKRINPHIKNIDRIRPGQVIDIPLKRLKQGTLPGQASGIVTIPFVTINKTIKLIKKHASLYTIQRGDCISKLISQRFGGYGSNAYHQGLKLLQSMNPGISDINKIYAGEKIYMPDPSIREQSWYDALFDAAGNIKTQIGGINDAEPAPVTAEVQAEPVEAGDAEGPVAEAAHAVGGTLKNKGTYYFPMKQGNTFELDLSQYPVIELQEDLKIILTNSDKVMNRDIALLQSYWKDVKLATIPENPTTPQVIESVLNALESDKSYHTLSFTDNPVEVSIRAKWIKTEKISTDGRATTLCITPISDPSQLTSAPIKRYLDQNGILINELITFDISSENKKQSGAFKISNAPLVISADSKRDLVEKLAKMMGFGYSKDVSISFPYAGIQVTALSNLLSFGSGREFLVDFGDLYGDAVHAIKETGLEIIQINIKDTEATIIEKLMVASGKAVSRNPVFLAAQRPAAYNTSIKIKGVMVKQHPDERILFTGTNMNPLIISFLKESNIRVVIVKVYSNPN